jgi:hypothetical protein
VYVDLLVPWWIAFPVVLCTGLFDVCRRECETVFTSLRVRSMMLFSLSRSSKIAMQRLIILDRLRAAFEPRRRVSLASRRLDVQSLLLSAGILLLPMLGWPQMNATSGNAKIGAAATAFQFEVDWPQWASTTDSPPVPTGNILNVFHPPSLDPDMPASQMRTEPGAVKFGHHWFAVMRVRQIFKETTPGMLVPCGHFAEVYVRPLDPGGDRTELIVRTSVPIKVTLRGASQIFVGDVDRGILFRKPFVLQPGDYVLTALRQTRGRTVATTSAPKD